MFRIVGLIYYLLTAVLGLVLLSSGLAGHANANSGSDAIAGAILMGSVVVGAALRPPAFLARKNDDAA